MKNIYKIIIVLLIFIFLILFGLSFLNGNNSKELIQSENNDIMN